MDSNVVIAAAKKDPVIMETLEVLEKDKVELVISRLTHIEVFSSDRITSLELSRITEIMDEIAVIYDVDKRIGSAAGFVRRAYHLKLPDAVIAATALLHSDGWLWSQDSVFRKIPELRLYNGK